MNHGVKDGEDGEHGELNPGRRNVRLSLVVTLIPDHNK